MRIAAVAIAGLTFALNAGAQTRTTREEFDAIWRQMRQMESRIHQTFDRAAMLRPVRRDEPLREMNLSDNEVREIQGLVVDHLPKDMVNISPVVAGCACEEGPSCSAQVYVVAMNGDYHRGLQLSRVDDAWRIGAIQTWWLEYEALAPKLRKMELREALEKRYALANRFPACAAKTAIDQVVTSNQAAKSDK
jgi:hypothetical protein